MLEKLKDKATLWLILGALKEGSWRQKLVIFLGKTVVAEKIAERIGGIKMASSWRTTAFGLIGAVGAYLVTAKDPAWLSIVGQILSAIAIAGVGMSARDSKVSSEDAGVK